CALPWLELTRGDKPAFAVLAAPLIRLCDGVAPGFARRILAVVGPGIAFPGVFCYDSHCLIPLAEGLNRGRVTLCLAAWSRARCVCRQHDAVLCCTRPLGCCARLVAPPVWRG